MINREITYVRDVHKSYMKIPAVPETCLDEKLIFQRDYQGLLPMEKCYVNGGGQYWYNISGKQALDAYCRVNAINQDFFERLILRICSQLEILEWNLIDSSCLVVDPELIFVNHTGEEISFVVYPNTTGDFFDELQQLMEYLLTKLNHNNRDDVHDAYRIYEMTLAKGYSVTDLKKAILERRKNDLTTESIKDTISIKEIAPIEEMGEEEGLSASSVLKEKDFFQEIEKKIQILLERAKDILWKKENKEEIPEVVMPEEEGEEQIGLHPTVCLAATLGEAKGILLYEGMGDYPDFQLEQSTCVLGKNPRVKLRIDRDTISQFHAKFDYYDKTYYIEDMNSTNGTFINDEVLNYKEKKDLSPGDVIRFADVKYRFL